METAHVHQYLHEATIVLLHSGLLVGHKKEENFTLCDSMDGSREHYAKGGLFLFLFSCFIFHSLNILNRTIKYVFSFKDVTYRYI